MIMLPSEPLTQTVGSRSFPLLFSMCTGINKSLKAPLEFGKKKNKNKKSLATVILKRF